MRNKCLRSKPSNLWYFCYTVDLGDWDKGIFFKEWRLQLLVLLILINVLSPDEGFCYSIFLATLRLGKEYAEYLCWCLQVSYNRKFDHQKVLVWIWLCCFLVCVLGKVNLSVFVFFLCRHKFAGIKPWLPGIQVPSTRSIASVLTEVSYHNQKQ